MLQSSHITETPVCPLQYVAELIGCRDECCPLWEPDAGCSARDYAVVARSTLADWLPQARTQLRSARTVEQREELRRLFHRLLAESPSA